MEKKSKIIKINNFFRVLQVVSFISTILICVFKPNLETYVLNNVIAIYNLCNIGKYYSINCFN